MFLEIEQEKLDQADEKLTDAKIVRDARLDIHQFLSKQMNYLVSLMHHEAGEDTYTSKIEQKEILDERIQQESAEGGSQYVKEFLEKMKLGIEIENIRQQKHQSLSTTMSSIRTLLQVIQQNIELGGQRMGEVISLIQLIESKDAQRVDESRKEYQQKFIIQPTEINLLKLLAINECILSQNHEFTGETLIEALSPQEINDLAISVN